MAEHEIKDADISRGCRQNRPDAWRLLVRRYSPLVYRLALRMLREAQAAEDATQEVFMAVHRAIDSHDPTRPLAPWLARITYNGCLKRLARTRRSADKELVLEAEDIPDPGPAVSPENLASRQQRSEQIEQALDRLSAQDRGLIVMRYREGFSDSEISHATGMPVGTVKTRLHRARSKLKKYLMPYFQEDFP